METHSPSASPPATYTYPTGLPTVTDMLDRVNPVSRREPHTPFTLDFTGPEALYNSLGAAYDTLDEKRSAFIELALTLAADTLDFSESGMEKVGMTAVILRKFLEEQLTPNLGRKYLIKSSAEKIDRKLFQMLQKAGGAAPRARSLMETAQTTYDAALRVIKSAKKEVEHFCDSKARITAATYAPHQLHGTESLYQKVLAQKALLTAEAQTCPKRKLAGRMTHLITSTPQFIVPTRQIHLPHVKALISGLENNESTLVVAALESLRLIEASHPTDLGVKVTLFDFYFDLFKEKAGEEDTTTKEEFLGKFSIETEFDALAAFFKAHQHISPLVHV